MSSRLLDTMANSRFNYVRRPSATVKIGNILLGGENPIRVQSMTNTNTLDTEASAEQILRIADAGGDIVRLTTQGPSEARNMANITRLVREKGCEVPLVADVHFNPKAAYEAAKTCDKVRINPGNFVDAARTFRTLTFTDEEYAAEIEKIRAALVPFLNLCKEYETAIRLGVNHGSLSDRIMSRYGDTPAGMVESVMEFLRICEEEDFRNIVISIKASNVVVMVQTVRLLYEAMESEGMAWPIHLGVTEAGDGEDGRVKSVVGIGTLLSEGIGDTIRVSLSEAPENEIPVALSLVEYIDSKRGHREVEVPETMGEFPLRESVKMEAEISNQSAEKIFQSSWPLVIGHDMELKAEDYIEVMADSDPKVLVDSRKDKNKIILLRSDNKNVSAEMQSWMERYVAARGKNPVALAIKYEDEDAELSKLKAAVDFGTMMLNGYGNAILIEIPKLEKEEVAQLALGILQASRLRFSKTEYIACPSCGRTLFDLPGTLAEVRRATRHLKGLKIGVMGCIVNGPGEMADADYGYVGAGPGRVSLYKRKELKIKNIPTFEALPALISLIRENGDWIDPE